MIGVHIVEPLIKDTPNNGHLFIKDKPILLLYLHINKGHLSINFLSTCTFFGSSTVYLREQGELVVHY